MSSRSQALAAELARRAIEAAEANQARQEDGEPPPSMNDLIRRGPSVSPRGRDLSDRLFGAPPSEPERSDKPQGNANGGEGEAERLDVTPTEHGPERVLDAAKLMSNPKEER